MAQRLISYVRTADLILKSGLITGNFNILVQVQPRRLELWRFLSGHAPPTPSKGFDKPSDPKEGNKNDAFTAKEIETVPKSSSLSVGSSGDGQGGDKEKSSSGPGSGWKNRTRIMVAISTAGILGVCGWVYIKKNQKDFSVKDVVDNFFDPGAAEDAEMKSNVKTQGESMTMLTLVDCTIAILVFVVWYLEAWK